MEEQNSRREFLRIAVTAVSVPALAEQVVAQTSSTSSSGLPTRPLGRTGQRVSIIGLGGGHIGGIKDDSEAIRVVQAAADEGITFFDNAWDYADGLAEERMGRALAAGNRREKVFLMTKNCERDYEGSIKDLEDSLRRLRTDHVDLWQFHEINYDNDPDWVFGKGGHACRSRSTEGRQGALHRLHRAQGPADSPQNAFATFQLGHCPDADQRDGRALSQLPAAGGPGVSKPKNRCIGHEGPGWRCAEGWP